MELDNQILGIQVVTDFRRDDTVNNNATRLFHDDLHIPPGINPLTVPGHDQLLFDVSNTGKCLENIATVCRGAAHAQHEFGGHIHMPDMKPGGNKYYSGVHGIQQQSGLCIQNHVHGLVQGRGQAGLSRKYNGRGGAQDGGISSRRILLQMVALDVKLNGLGTDQCFASVIFNGDVHGMRSPIQVRESETG